MEIAALKPVTLNRKETKTMIEETLTGPCKGDVAVKPKRNVAVLALAVAIALSMLIQARILIKTSALEKRITAVENMFAK